MALIISNFIVQGRLRPPHTSTAHIPMAFRPCTFTQRIHNNFMKNCSSLAYCFVLSVFVLCLNGVPFLLFFATIFLVYLGIWVSKAPCYFHYLKLLTLVLESSKLSLGKNWDSSPSHLHWICLPSYWEFLLYFFLSSAKYGGGEAFCHSGRHQTDTTC